ncbi:hypothetical protein M5C97_05200 [Acidovorax sp. NCPPB 3859]|nr:MULTISPECIES: hypothetical protein [unclassified Acidovorax]MDA8448615.1 hypothetical protein [Acidovorax sp. GBBC 3297]MDA8458266.1 hypothetical protein [Acidovorax sp. GBBC 3333]MDA8463304.1 hypothetical protein [Acidovorax sp. GBBC 3332]MDA8468091.1 hypothetical protein [Acidovorax sp. GBBC 3299]WCM79701.1 hypothetical protein M5C94_05195 [Acidovorax sp. GBBC 712]
MSEFNNRIDAQRRILRLVNGYLNVKEELFGLSSAALERWERINGFSEHEPLLDLLKQAAGKLFFLSNKSQEQITEEYRNLSADVELLIEEIRIAVASRAS